MLNLAGFPMRHCLVMHNATCALLDKEDTRRAVFLTGQLAVFVCVGLMSDVFWFLPLPLLFGHRTILAGTQKQSWLRR